MKITTSLLYISRYGKLRISLAIYHWPYLIQVIKPYRFSPTSSDVPGCAVDVGWFRGLIQDLHTQKTNGSFQELTFCRLFWGSIVLRVHNHITILMGSLQSIKHRTSKMVVGRRSFPFGKVYSNGKDEMKIEFSSALKESIW